MTLPPRVDWWRVITDLNYAGYSNGRIAEELLLVSKTWIARLRNENTEPRHRDGEMLLDLWARVMRCQASDAPRLTGHPSLGAKERARMQRA